MEFNVGEHRFSLLGFLLPQMHNNSEHTVTLEYGIIRVECAPPLLQKDTGGRRHVYGTSRGLDKDLVLDL